MNALLLSLVLAAEIVAPPEPTATVSLSLQEAVTRAREASPRVRERRAREAAARAAAEGAQAARRPLVDVGASATRLSDVPELALTLPDGVRRTVFANVPNNLAARVGFAVPLYQGGRLVAAQEAAEREAEAAGGDLRTELLDLDLRVRLGFWNLVTARETERVLREAQVAYEAHLADARNRERVGIAARNELLAVQVERDRAELARIQAENSAAVAEADLRLLLDLPEGTAVVPAEPLVALAPTEAGISTLLASALETRPERQALQARAAAAEASARAERGGWYPRVRLSGGYDYARPNRRIVPILDTWEDSWDVGVAMGFDLWDGGRTRAAVARAQGTAEAARASVEEMERRIRLEVTARLLELQSARAAVAVTETNLAAAAENRKVASDRYRAGVSPSSELLDAELLLLRAGLDRVETLARVRAAEAGLDRALGR
jgi:outer membrane protein TolC